MPNKSQTSAREDYLKAVYRLSEGTDRLVSTTAIAALLGVRKPSVTGMVKRLAGDGLIEYSPR